MSCQIGAYILKVLNNPNETDDKRQSSFIAKHKLKTG